MNVGSLADTLSPEAIALLRNILDNIGNAPGGAPVLSIARPLIELDDAVKNAMAAINQMITT